MTPDLARDICRWIQNSLALEQAPGRLIRSAQRLPKAALHYLLERHTAQALVLTPRGWAVDERIAQIESLLAEECLAQQDPDPEPVTDEPQDSPVTPPPAGIAWTLCDAAEARQRLDTCSSKLPERQQLLKTLAEQPVRYLPQASAEHLAVLRALADDFPHFQPAIDILGRQLLLQIRTGGALRLGPLLLLGPSGIGKTEFGRRLAQALDLICQFHSLADISGHFLLTGNSKAWNQATPGIVAKLIAGCPDGRAPLLILDELDKVRRDMAYSPETALLGLLERSTARAFRDEHLDLVLDASPLSCLLTANRLHGLRPELLSRLSIVEIPPPTPAQMPAVVRSIDSTLREETPELDLLFAPLDAPLIESLACQPPRQLKRRLEEAYARALEGNGPGPLRLLPAHFPRGLRPPPAPPQTYIAPLLVQPQPGPWRH